ncbi:MAG: exonuclease SbcCD subunit D [Clostridia bacterium]|nr:exonuclease SbcCD subunit D [Clostridia bacterium]
MKFIHLSDLHIGKRVNEYSMLEDQQYILEKIIKIADEEKPDGVIIAGDVYDKTVPSAEAMQLFDDFLVMLSKRHLKVFIISGNHDSPERLAFGRKFMKDGGIYISPVYDGNIEPIVLEDDFGNLNVWMLPFIKPSHVRHFNENAVIESYTDAVQTAIRNFKIDTNERNILITHQFVCGAERTESEEISVGGSDAVAVDVFDDFDYTALGHIHRAQNCSSEKVRYSGTPLKYSFSESKDKKSVTVVELREKGQISVKETELIPLHDMVEIKGKYEDIMLHDFYKDTTYNHDYMHITLTNEEEITDVIGKLRTVYKNIMKLDYDNTRTRSSNRIENNEASEQKTPFEQFSQFFELQNNMPMTDKQKDFMLNLIEQVWEEEL